MKSNLFYSNIESKIVSNLKNAQKTVKIAMAWFTNPNLFNLIENLVDNNIRVELVLSDEKLNFINEKVNFQRLIDKNVSIKVSKFPNLMHNKFCLIDNRILISGSYNWTLKAEKSNYENIVISTDEKLVDDFISYFDFLKNTLGTVSTISTIKFQEYIDKNEVDVELQLIREENNQSVEIINPKKENIYDDELNNLIDKADLLYLNGKIQESINFINPQLENYKKTPELYQLLALCYWRLKDFDKQILYAQKVIELENETKIALDAYNLLGIGYSHKKGGEQQSIFYYKKCIDEKPNEHAFYRNRAISYVNLENEVNLPPNIRNKYKLKADADLNKIIDIAKDTSNKDYQLLHSEALANSYLGNDKIALVLINKSIEAFELEKDLFMKDNNELKEMKFLQKALLKTTK